METLAAISRWLAKQHVVTWCVQNEGELWCANAFYYYDPERVAFYVLSEDKTRHAQMSGPIAPVAGKINGQPKNVALIRAVHQRRNPAARFHVIDVADLGMPPDCLVAVRSELRAGADPAASAGLLVLRHAHLLNGHQVRALTDALAEAKSSGQAETLRVAVTLDRDAARADLSCLLRLFPDSVDVPPLRHHSEDLRDLVPFFLGKLSQQGRVTCSSSAMQLLLRHTWPGNTAQLWQVLRQVVQRRRVGQILPEDLPPECWTVSRRVLSPLESIERDAIVQSLLDHGGNKIRAARALGMSRATIYRRIREYGIITS